MFDRRASKMHAIQNRAARAGVLFAVLFALSSLTILVSSASARRTATPSESRAMWKVVDRASRCVHHRGKISTVRAKRFRYGVVTVADSQCGNGSYVMRRNKHRHRWYRVLAGSDIGYSDRCYDDVEKVPARVLEDLFPGMSLECA